MEKLLLLIDWAARHPALITQMALVSLVLAATYAVGIFFAIVHMSSDYFVQKTPADATWRRQHPLLRLLFRGLKNFAGSVVVLLGIAMLVLPGQGIFTILIGLTLLDFPGKRRLEILIVRRPSIRHGIDRVRKRVGQSPLILPDL